MSVVLDYLRSTYDNCCSEGCHSWNVINDAMRIALEVAIKGRFKFEKGDFQYLSDPSSELGYSPYGYLGFYRWIGKDTAYSYGERFYNYAVESSNKSACIAFESWKKRKPFVLSGKRLSVRSTFGVKIDNAVEWWVVGSFSESGEKINISLDKRRKSLTPKELREWVKSFSVATPPS